MNQTSTSVGETSKVLPPPLALLKNSFSFYKSKLGLIISIAIIPLIVEIVGALANQASEGVGTLLGIIGGILFLFSYLAVLNVVAETPQNFSDAYRNSVRILFPAAWIMILSTLTVVGGGFLFIIPGIFLSTALCLSMYILVVENKRGMSALVSSWNYVKGYWWAVFGRAVVLAILIFIATLILTLITGGNLSNKEDQSVLTTIVLLLFNTLLFTPVSMVYSVKIYQALKQIKGSEVSPEEEKRIKRNIWIFIIIAILGVIVVCLLLGTLILSLIQVRGSNLGHQITPGGLPFAPIIDFLK